MRSIFKRFGAAALAVALALVALPGTGAAQTFPYTHPTYVPNGTLAAQTLTAPGTYQFVTGGAGSVSFRVLGSRSSLVASVQGTNDQAGPSGFTNWTNLVATPVGGGAPVNSISANGLWVVQTAGLTAVRVNVTTLSGGNVIISGASSLTPAEPLQGTIPSHYLSSASTNSTLVKAAAGLIIDGVAQNTGASTVYLKLYDTATAPTCGSGTPVATLAVPNGGAPVKFGTPLGLGFVNGIGFCITGAIADADTTSAVVGAVVDLATQ
jgi:hypothetical protein